MSDLTADLKTMYGDDYAVGLSLSESTPEVEDMLSGLFDGMRPKLITLPDDVSLEQYYEAKALVARCEGDDPMLSVFAGL